ncbi:hypothetical protein JTB14_001128 [Gonioctena quinquepunctata]|nr:hypothetical protein JTB14_001128 [Gonioctena quinquepunctata]
MSINSNKAIKYGIENEKRAVADYEALIKNLNTTWAIKTPDPLTELTPETRRTSPKNDPLVHKKPPRRKPPAPPPSEYGPTLERIPRDLAQQPRRKTETSILDNIRRSPLDSSKTPEDALKAPRRQTSTKKPDKEAIITY